MDDEEAVDRPTGARPGTTPEAGEAATEPAGQRAGTGAPDGRATPPGGDVDVDALAQDLLAGMETVLGRFAGVDQRDTSLATLMALTRIVQEFVPSDAPVVVEGVVTAIDTVVRHARFTGWSQTENGDRTVRFEIGEVLKSSGLAATGPLLDRLHACVRANY